MPEKPKILIVDDKKENLYALEKILSDLEITFVQALSGNEALAHTLEHDFALALIDVNMPDMDGFETVRLMRTDRKTALLPVIFISAVYSDTDYMIKGIETGGIDFITKPIIPQVLIGKVSIFLEMFANKKEQLYKHKLELEQLVEELSLTNKELAMAKEQAETSNILKSKFLAMISHEIRTPLNAINGMTDLVLMSDSPREQNDYITTIKKSSDHLLDIVNNILDMSKIEAQKFELRVSAYNLQDIVSTIENLFVEIMKEKGLTFSCTIEPDVPVYLRGDHLRLKQVLINLIGNAVKFTEKGSITVNISRIQKKAPMLRIAVTDTGIGIPNDRVINIFDSYTQAGLSYFREYKGTGLGLSISKYIIGLMQGTFEVESAVNLGSTFYVTIPLVEAEKSEVETSGQNGQNHGQNNDLQGYNILFVEDDSFNAKLGIALLKKTRCDFAFAENGKQAIALLKQQTFDIVIMDIEMPVINGIEATEKIRNGEAGRNNSTIPIIVMSAHVVEDIKQKCLEAGINHFITKPINIKEIAPLIRKIVK